MEIIIEEIEMGTLMLLARMELTGLGVSLNSLQELSDVIQREMSQLEKRAYSLAGRQFNFSSSKSVAQVSYPAVRLVTLPVPQILAAMIFYSRFSDCTKERK